jgi:hypothetical protein
MKQVARFTSSCLLIFSLLSISLLTPMTTQSSTIARAATNEVSLLTAELYNPSYNCPMSICASIRGEIEVLNIAYAKKVSVLFSTGNNVWVEAPANYLASVDGNYEVWSFNSKLTDSGASYAEKSIQMAVKYVVGGHTYWDNNNGQNYKFGGPTLPWKMLFKSALTFDCVLGTGCFTDNATLSPAEFC